MEANMEVILVYVTHPDRAAARAIVDRLLDARLIACANTLPIASTYRWKGAVEHAEEVVTVLKTRAALWPRVAAEIAAVHPYEVPCIVRVPAAASGPFAAWIYEETCEA